MLATLQDLIEKSLRTGQVARFDVDAEEYREAEVELADMCRGDVKVTATTRRREKYSRHFTYTLTAQGEGWTVEFTYWNWRGRGL